MGQSELRRKRRQNSAAMEKVLVILVFSLQIMFTSSQILGAGTGIGSCRAPPFRSSNVNWDVCPPTQPCCSEYGYCRTREEWKQLKFRDCNGESNGIDLPLSVLILEEQLRRGANSPGLNPEDTLTNQIQNNQQNNNQNNRFSQNQNNANSQNRFSNENNANSQNRFANQNQNNAFSNQNQNNRLSVAQNNGFQNQQSNLQNQQNSGQNLNNFLPNPSIPFPGQLPNNAVFSGTSSSSGSSSSSSSASSSSSSNSASSSFGFVPNNPVFGQSSSSSSSASSSSAASAANNFQNQNTFQIVGTPAAGAGVGVQAGVVTGVTGGGASGISEGQAVSISLINQNSGNQGSKKKKKNPFGFGNRVTKKPKKPNNINQILENIFEEEKKEEKPPKRPIVIRPQNSNKKPPRQNEKDKLTAQSEDGSPLVGYQNTGGYPMDLDGVNCPNY